MIHMKMNINGLIMTLNKAKEILNENGYGLDISAELQRKKDFIEKLEKYHEFIDDFQYALKSTKEGLKSTSLEDMESYVADETRFLMNMVKKFNTKLKNDLINDIKKS